MPIVQFRIHLGSNLPKMNMALFTSLILVFMTSSVATTPVGQQEETISLLATSTPREPLRTEPVRVQINMSLITTEEAERILLTTATASTFSTTLHMSSLGKVNTTSSNDLKTTPVKGHDLKCGNVTCNITLGYVCVNMTCVNCSINETCIPGTSAPPTKPRIYPVSDYRLIDKLAMAAFSLIFVIGTIGNGFVCYLFGWEKRKHRKIPETLFFYLGIVDLIASIVNPFLFIYLLATKYSRWDFGVFACKVLSGVAPVSASLSAIMICIIAVDRYFIIVNPFGRRYTKRHVRIAVLVGILLACLLHAHYIYYVEDSEVYGTCVVVKVTKLFQMWGIVSFFAQNLVCLSVFLYTNIRIFQRLNDNESMQQLERISARRKAEHKGIIKILTLMGVLFFISVLPRDMFHIIYTISWLDPPGIYPSPSILNLNSAFKVLQTANSCINVFIYSRMHKYFQVNKYLAAVCCTSSQKPVENTNGTLAPRGNGPQRADMDKTGSQTNITAAGSSLTPSPIPKRHNFDQHLDVTRL